MPNMNERELRRYRQFFITYPQIGDFLASFLENNSIRGTLSAELQLTPIRGTLFPESCEKSHSAPIDKIMTRLSFSHLSELMEVADPLKRVFYEMECMKGHWSVRELKRQINTLYYERNGMSKNPEKLSRMIQSKAELYTPEDLIKSPFTFEFLGLKVSDVIEENQLERALLDHLQNFLLELGHGFCFEARQKRMLIGDEYFFIDLVFYHRILKCHVLIELKVGEFKHVNAGQLNTYLNYYKAEEMQPGDQLPVGILLVTNKNDALVEYATAGMNENVFVSKYLVELPQKEELEAYIKQELKKH
jgi:predicted nuclease of restriction endonuclease-like (RecB) superfamily